eukprot:6033167-Pleurochrysis_carterae.AAC.1
MVHAACRLGHRRATAREVGDGWTLRVQRISRLRVVVRVGVPVRGGRGVGRPVLRGVRRPVLLQTDTSTHDATRRRTDKTQLVFSHFRYGKMRPKSNSLADIDCSLQLHSWQ